MNHKNKLQLLEKEHIVRERSYAINHIFYSLQGEGVRAGSANIFVRFAGCNLSCSRETHGFDCDTEFSSATQNTVAGILSFCQELAPDCKWVIFTGGEPLLQLDTALCTAFKRAGYSLAVETNGSIEPDASVLTALDWITCSPKVAEHAVRLSRCDELKYVRSLGQGIPRPRLKDVSHKLISPAFQGDSLDSKTLAWCIELVKQHPEWRLSMQQHKIWDIL